MKNLPEKILPLESPRERKECLEYPYENFETNIKSPTSKLGFMEPDGILNGSNNVDLINTAIKMAIDTETKLLKILFFFI